MMKLAKSILVVCLSLALSGCSGDSFTREHFAKISKNLSSVVNAWSRSQPRMSNADQPYNVFLVIDANEPAIWVERNGMIKDDEKCQLPGGFQWEVVYVNPAGHRALESPVRLKQRGDTSKAIVTREVIFVQGREPKGNSGMHFTITASGHGIGWGKVKQWNFTWGPKRNIPDDIDQSFIVTPEEYTGK